MAPLWRAQQAGWGAAAVLFQRLALPARWLCQTLRNAKEVSALPVPVVRLVVSSVSTVFKAAQVAGMDPSNVVYSFTQIQALCGSASGWPHTIVSLLLPRNAAVFSGEAAGTLLGAAIPLDFGRAMSHCDDAGCEVAKRILLWLSSSPMSILSGRLAVCMSSCYGPATREHSHYAVGGLCAYASDISLTSGIIAINGCEGAPPGSDELRDLLAQPFLRLLGSPLLDLLAALQHVVMVAISGFCDQGLPRASIPPVHLLPASLNPDARGSEVAMQVGLGLCSMWAPVRRNAWRCPAIECPLFGGGCECWQAKHLLILLLIFSLVGSCLSHPHPPYRAGISPQYSTPWLRPSCLSYLPLKR